MRVLKPYPDFQVMSIDDRQTTHGAKPVDSQVLVALENFQRSASEVQFDLGHEILHFHHHGDGGVPGFPTWQRWFGKLGEEDPRRGHLLLLHHEESGEWTGMFFVEDDFYRVVPQGMALQAENAKASLERQASWNDALRIGSLLQIHPERLVEERVSTIESQCIVEDDPDYQFPRAAPPPSRDQPFRLDALVIFTQAAEKAIGQKWPIIADLLSPAKHHLLLAQEVTNWSFVLSSMPVTLAATSYVLTDQEEADVEKAWSNGSTPVDKFWWLLASGQKGVFRRIGNLRVSRNADLVLFIEAEAEGQRMVPSGKVCDRKDEDRGDAFALVKWDQAIDQLVFPHEIGHVLGAGHHEADWTGFSAYWRPYARGWCHDANLAEGEGAWSTIMTKDSCQYATRLPYWSGRPPAEDHESHNNADAIMERAPQVEAYFP